MTNQRVPRIRVFAGPNGSGKTTLVQKLQAINLPLYSVINPDDIEQDLNSEAGLDLSYLGANRLEADFLRYTKQTTYSSRVKSAARKIHFDGHVAHAGHSAEGSYNAALVAGFLRSRLVKMRQSFSFESVFSHHSKLEELKLAKKRGFRIYLYYVATEAPELAIGRVTERVARGGHAVPIQKIRTRHAASLLNLLPALRIAYRAYVFDNSGSESRLLAEKTPYGNLNLVGDRMPVWFATHVIDSLAQ